MGSTWPGVCGSGSMDVGVCGGGTGDGVLSLSGVTGSEVVGVEGSSVPTSVNGG